MTVDLDKEDLICLVMAKTPDYKQFNHPIIKKCGKYIGGFVERWDWDVHKLREMSEQQP